MRLTLRTLLAWLDSLLPPPDQQALAEKVAASPMAPSLVRRIQDVVETPGLGAPRIDARGLADDANSVAEYLDNCLAAEQLEGFERICIESDMHLAEVASCHGILAEMSRDDGAVAPIDAAMRNRLLAAIRDHVAARPEEMIGARPNGGAMAPAGVTARHERPHASGPRRRRAPLGAWISAAVAVALLGGLATVFVRSLLPTETDRRVAVKDQEAAPPPPLPSGEVLPPSPAAPGEPPEPAPLPVQPPRPPAGVASPAEPKPESLPAATSPAGQPPAATAKETVAAAGPVPPAGRAAPGVAEPPAAGRQLVPHGDALAIAAPAPAGGQPRPVEEQRRVPPTEPPPSPMPAASEAVVSGLGLLLHRPVADEVGAQPVHGTSGWAVLPPGADVAAREDLMAPPMSRPEVTVAGVTIRLEPDSRATLTRDGDGTPRLELVFGRAAVRAAGAGTRLGITAGGLAGVVVAGLRDPVGVEVLLDRQPGAEAGASRMRSTIAATTAAIRWRQTRADGNVPNAILNGIAADGLLEAGRRLAWDSSDPDSAAVLPSRGLEWIAAPPRVDRVEAAAAAAVQARLAGGQPFDKTLREIAADPREREENRAQAAATLALVGDYDELVRLLCAESGATGLRGSRWRKLEQATVPLALARGANAAERLSRAFEEHAPAGRGRQLVWMARGVGDDELAAGADARLVDGLDDSELVVRRYAHHALSAIVPQADPTRSLYDPERSAELRRDAVAWWRKQQETGRIRRQGAAAP